MLCSSLLQTSTWQLTYKLSVTLMLPAFSPSRCCARVNAGWHSSVHSAVQLNWDVSTHVFRSVLINVLDVSAHLPQLFLLNFFCVKLMVLIKVLSFWNGSEAERWLYWSFVRETHSPCFEPLWFCLGTTLTSPLYLSRQTRIFKTVFLLWTF